MLNGCENENEGEGEGERGLHLNRVSEIATEMHWLAEIATRENSETDQQVVAQIAEVISIRWDGIE